VYTEFSKICSEYPQRTDQMKELIHKNSPMNGDVCERNLIEISNYFKNNDIQFFVCFGTLLGAIREENFIATDTDTDIVIRKSFVPKLFNAIAEEHIGNLEILRCQDSIISIAAGNEYIDIYLYLDGDQDFYCYGENKPKYDIRKCDMRSGRFVRIRGQKYPTIKNPEIYLKYWYGIDWQTPRSRQWCIDNKIYENWENRISQEAFLKNAVPNKNKGVRKSRKLHHLDLG
jgi:hypothetical protein